MSHPVAEEAPAEHFDALNLVRDAVAAGSDQTDALQRAVDVLHDRFPSYDWVGLYWLDEAAGELVLGSWRGDEPTEHTRIPLGVGICGAAAASGQTEIVEDVSADPRYLACFTTTRSEIVVPIFAEGRVVGVAFAVAPDKPGVAYALAVEELEPVLAGDLSRARDTGGCLV